MVRYTSLLLRIWKDSEQVSDHSSTGWQAEIEQIQAARCMTFDSPEALIAYFERYVQHVEDWEINVIPEPHIR